MAGSAEYVGKYACHVKVDDDNKINSVLIISRIFLRLIDLVLFSCDFMNIIGYKASKNICILINGGLIPLNWKKD